MKLPQIINSLLENDMYKFSMGGTGGILLQPEVCDARGRGGVRRACWESGLGGGSGGAASSDAAVFPGENAGRALLV